jgi:hypothetical protein
VLGRGKARDRQRGGGECGGANARDSGQRGQDLAPARRQQLLDLLVDEGNVVAQRLKGR